MPDSTRPLDPALFDASTPISADFFRYANGGWLDANPVPPEYPAWGSFHEVKVRNEELLHRLLQATAEDPGPTASAASKVGIYFRSGMDEAAIAASGIKALQPLFERIDAVKTLAQLPDVVREMQLVGASPFHDVAISSDFEDADRYLVYVGQGGQGLPERDYYLKVDEQSAGLRAAYLSHIGTQLANLGEEPELARRLAEAILVFETTLAEHSYSAEQQRDVQLVMNRHAIDSLDELMPRFGLTSYVRAFGVIAPSVNIDNAGFFRHLDTLLAETPLDTLRAYLRWHLVRTYATSLPAEFEDEAFDFYGRKLGGQQEQQPRWKRILGLASNDIGELVSRLYVEAAFPPEAKARCEAMVDQLLRAMRRSIENLTWMTEPTREAALAKLATFSYKIGYPDAWRDHSALVLDGGSFTENRMRAIGFEVQRQLARLDEPVDKTEWEMPAHSVNAYYNPLLNEIVFPAGILQPPFFDASADDAVIYGGIGTVIGHEITHGFDDQGSRFDEAGSLRDWWSEQDRAEFERLTSALVGQFDAYEVLAGVHVNGRLTLGENIADLGGVAIAYDALLGVIGDDAPPIDGLTPAQRFFLAYATIWRMNSTEAYQRLLVNVDPHSPGRFRVNGPLSNFPPFAAAFQIDRTAPMARAAEDRVKIW